MYWESRLILPKVVWESVSEKYVHMLNKDFVLVKFSIVTLCYPCSFLLNRHWKIFLDILQKLDIIDSLDIVDSLDIIDRLDIITGVFSLRIAHSIILVSWDLPLSPRRGLLSWTITSYIHITSASGTGFDDYLFGLCY